MAEMFTYAPRANICQDPEVFIFHEVSGYISAENKTEQSVLCWIYNALTGLSLKLFFSFKGIRHSCLVDFIKHTEVAAMLLRGELW